MQKDARHITSSLKIDDAFAQPPSKTQQSRNVLFKVSMSMSSSDLGSDFHACMELSYVTDSGNAELKVQGTDGTCRECRDEATPARPPCAIAEVDGVASGLASVFGCGIELGQAVGDQTGVKQGEGNGSLLDDELMPCAHD